MKKIIFYILFVNILFANEITFNSSEKKVNIIELYTSQGCSSCPVAEEWINGLKNNNKVFKEFIPLVFHVTYWDFIGWKDVFGNSLYDKRQRNYANKIWRKNSVYTPQFVINTKEYRRWFSNQSFPRFENSYGGKLKLMLKNQDLDITFNSKGLRSKKLTVNVALLGFDYETKITAGENDNRRLEGDFVVLNHQQNILSFNNGKLIFNTTLPNYKNDGHKKAVVVWLNDQDGTIIQATGGYI